MSYPKLTDVYGERPGAALRQQEPHENPPPEETAGFPWAKVRTVAGVQPEVPQRHLTALEERACKDAVLLMNQRLQRGCDPVTAAPYDLRDPAQRMAWIDQLGDEIMVDYEGEPRRVAPLSRRKGAPVFYLRAGSEVQYVATAFVEPWTQEKQRRHEERQRELEQQAERSRQVNELRQRLRQAIPADDLERWRQTLDGNDGLSVDSTASTDVREVKHKGELTKGYPVRSGGRVVAFRTDEGPIPIGEIEPWTDADQAQRELDHRRAQAIDFLRIADGQLLGTLLDAIWAAAGSFGVDIARSVRQMRGGHAS